MSISYAATDRMNIAVMELIGQGIDAPSSSIISDRLRTEIVKSGMVSLLERSAMQDILKEQGFQQTGCTSDACAVEMGQLLGVSHMVVGSVGKLGKLITLNIRLIEISTGKIQYSESIDCQCAIEEVLTESVPKLAKKIVNNVNVSNMAQPVVKLPDSQKNQPSKKGKSPVFKITFGTAALVTAVAGAACDQLMKKKVDENTQLKAEYLNLGTDADHASYQAKINQTATDAKKFQMFRNVCYGLAGASCIGFVLTFVF